MKVVEVVYKIKSLGGVGGGYTLHLQTKVSVTHLKYYP